MAKSFAQRAAEKLARAHRESYYDTKILKHLAQEAQPTVSLCGRDFRRKAFKLANRAEWMALEEKYKCKTCKSLE